MKKLKYCLLFLSFIQLWTKTPQKQLLILDTSGNSQASYSQLQALAESVGFDCSFANFYSPPSSLQSFDTVFLFLDPYFFKNSGESKKSPLTTRILSLIKAYAQKENGLLAILFPGKLPQNPQVTHALCGFFNQLNINHQLCTITNDLGPCIFSTDNDRSATYRTSLLYPRVSYESQKKSLRCRLSSLKKLDHKPLTLPADRKKSYLESILPLGLYVKPHKHAALVLGPDSSFKGADLEENMFFSPYDWKDRKKFLTVLQHTLLQLHTTLTTGQPPKETPVEITLPPKVLPQESKLYTEAIHPLFHKKISCAWMEIEPLKNNWKTAVDYLKQSNVNLLWTSFNPEWFLSKQAIRSQKEYEKVTTGIHHFTKELANTYRKQEKPSLFVGFDLTNNYGKSSVSHPVINVYGKEFSKIPSPLDDQHFWKEEFIDPFKKFITHWKEHADKHVSIGGIFFDFEMYHAPEQAAVYTNLMDFSDLSWNLYIRATKQSNLKKLTTINKRINFLFKNNRFDEYFSTLQDAAKQLGIKLKNIIKKDLPDALIGAYLPSLLDCWFYRGLFAGLGSTQEPLILATFNLNYYSHKPWFKQHGIHAVHLPVVMLSHITDKTHPNFDLIKYHHGIWINRFSRFFQSCKKSDWYNLECSEHNPSLVIRKLRAYTGEK